MAKAHDYDLLRKEDTDLALNRGALGIADQNAVSDSWRWAWLGPGMREHACGIR